jgi:hypothetical protein
VVLANGAPVLQFDIGCIDVEIDFVIGAADVVVISLEDRLRSRAMGDGPAP